MGSFCCLQKAIGDEGILFAQTMSRDAQGMVEEAKRLRDTPFRALW
ncbi:hypothetical protein ACLBOM_37980 [Escherichia coli]